jgi:hypothetical protein
VEHFSGYLLKGWLLALPTNIKIGWKDLPEEKHYSLSETLEIKSFITSTTGLRSGRLPSADNSNPGTSFIKLLQIFILLTICL